MPTMYFFLYVVEAELKAVHNVTPGLAVILVGSRKDSQSYVCVPAWPDG